MTRARSLSRLANTNAFTVDASQRVGIGSTQPDVRLDVNGDMNVTGTLTYEDVTNVETAGITTTGGLVVTGLGATIGGITTFFGDLNFGAAGVGGTITPLGHAEFVGVVTASSFRGDGSQLSGVDSSNLIDSGSTNRVAANTSGIVVTGIATVTSDIKVTSSSTNALVNLKGSGSTNGGQLQVNSTNLLVRNRDNGNLQLWTNDSERLRVDSSGRLLVGSDTTITDDNFGIGNLQVTDKTGFQHVLFSGHSASASNATALSLGRSRGSQSSPGYLSSGDHIARFSATSYNGGNYGSSGCIDFFAADQHASNDLPGYIVFNTVPDGSATLTERLRITSAGRVGIGTNEPDRLLVVAGSDPIIRSEDTDTGNTYAEFKQIAGSLFIDSRNDSSDGTIIFRGVGGGSATEKIRLGPSGQIGIAGANYGTSGQVLTSKGSGSAVAWEDASGGGGITTQVGNASGIVTSMFLTDATDHKVTATGICTITTTQAGTEGQSHTIRIVNSGIATVGFSTYFLFPSGSAPSLPTADGAVSLISFTVHDSVGAGCTQLLAGASVNFS